MKTIKSSLENAKAFFRATEYSGEAIEGLALIKGKVLLRELEKVEKRVKTLESLYDSVMKEIREIEIK